MCSAASVPGCTARITSWASCDVIGGTVAGRRSEDEVTVFKSLGLAVEDVVAAGMVV